MHFLILHLAEHEERLQILKKRISFFPQHEFEIVDAIKHEKGHEGCRLSHIKAVELAKSRNWKSCWVLEDDFLFVNPSCLFQKYGEHLTLDQVEHEHSLFDRFEVLENIQKQIENGEYDVFHSGASSSYDKNITCQSKTYTLDFQTPNKHVLDHQMEHHQLIQGVFTGFQCVCYGSSAFDIVSQCFPMEHIDVFVSRCGNEKGLAYLKSKQPTSNLHLIKVYTIFPFFTCAYSSRSSIRNTNVDLVQELKLFYRMEQAIANAMK